MRRIGLLELYHCDACAPELNMFVSCVTDRRHGFEVLSYELSEETRSCAVQDAHTLHTHLGSVINEMHNGVEGFFASHASYVNILFEGKGFLAHRILRLTPQECDTRW